MTQKRPPIVVVMGHVDHGKTTLLDHIRKMTFRARAASSTVPLETSLAQSGREPRSVAEREAGGITQSIGAYEILHGDEKITFIDTPGHEAFGRMRGHGARVADLAILVVAADDGVKPQTKEALASINAAKLSYVVAVNKIDKPNADVEKIKKELNQAGVYLEGYGGDVSWHAVSAKTGEGVNELLDLVLLATDIQNLTYDPAAPTSGIVLSSHLDPRRGLLVSVVLKNGTLRAGEAIGTGTAFGKIKVLENFLGKAAKTLEPAAPALITGFENSPAIGEEFTAGPAGSVEAPLDELKRKVCAPEMSAAADGGPPAETLNVILKADEAGSLEALADLLPRIPTVKPIRIIQQGIGQVYENDVKLAATTGSVILGFRTKVDRAAENLAQAQRVTILISPVIYHLEEALKKQVGPATVARTITVLALFGTPRGKERVVGGKVTVGPIRNQESFAIERNGERIGGGKILNLQSKKVDIPEAPEGIEVGMLVDADPIAVDDILSFSDFVRTE
ncbi:MAG: translation initiation factor IF-2 [Candidatus Jorgensenbacteria bacterium]